MFPASLGAAGFGNEAPANPALPAGPAPEALVPFDLNGAAPGDVVGFGARVEDGSCFVAYHLTSTLTRDLGSIMADVEPGADCQPRIVALSIAPRVDLAPVLGAPFSQQEVPATRETAGPEEAPESDLGFATHRWETQAEAWTWNYGACSTCYWDQLTWTRDVQTWQWDGSCAYTGSVDAYGMPGVGWTMTRNVWNYAETSCTRVWSWSEADFHYWTGPCSQWTHGLHAAVRGLNNGAISYDNYYWGCPVFGVHHENKWIYDKQV